jgi:TPR repeat protein
MKPRVRSLIPHLALAAIFCCAHTHATTAEPSAEYDKASLVLKDPKADADSKKGAFETIKDLAESGHLKSMAALGYLYQEGIGTQKDNSRAGQWLEKAAGQGHAISMFNLAGLLVNDRLPLNKGEKDRTRQYAEGVDWYRRAADAGLERARVAYGIILMRGDYGAKPDAAKAASYLIATAEAGNLEAMNALGNMYEIGNGVPYQPATAEIWFRRAAERGHLKSRSNLSGILDPQSTNHSRRIEAIAWLILADQDGDVVGKKVFATKAPAWSAQDMLEARRKAAEIRRTIDANRKDQNAGNAGGD